MSLWMLASAERKSSGSLPSDLYPVVQDLSDVEYHNESCCENEDDHELRCFPPCLADVKMLSSDDETFASSSRASSVRTSLRSQKSWRTLLSRSASDPPALLDCVSSDSVATTRCSTVTSNYPEVSAAGSELPTKEFETTYVLTRQIFRCSMSVVWECVHRESGQRYCVKVFDRNMAAGSGLTRDEYNQAVRHEVDMLKAVQLEPRSGRRRSTTLQRVTRLVEVIEQGTKVYLVLQLATGGNLLTRVVQQQQHQKGLSEPTVQTIARSLLLGLEHLHGQGICHGHLEPSNVLLEAASDHAVLADFGRAIRLRHVDSSRHLRLLSILRRADLRSVYTAPEVSRQHAAGRLLGFDTCSDMWSVGVIVFYCLFGHTPPSLENNRVVVSTSRSSLRSHSSHHHELYRADSGLFPSTRTNIYSNVSRQAKQFLTALLQLDPTVRLTAQEALSHPWLVGTRLGPSTAVANRGVLTLPMRPTGRRRSLPTFSWRPVVGLWKKLHCQRRRSNRHKKNNSDGTGTLSAELSPQALKANKDPFYHLLGSRS